MGQGSEVAATTDERRFLHALRPVAMLGGFVVIWWCLATGAAQADSGSEPQGGAKALTGTVHRAVPSPVHRAADRATERAPAHSSAPAKAAKAVRHHAAPVLSATSSVARKTPAEPVLTGASDTVRSQVAPVLERARSVAQATPISGSLTPTFEGATDIIDGLPMSGESSTLQGETRATGSLDDAANLVAGGPTASLDAASRTVLADRGQAAPSTHPGGGSEGPALRSSGVTGASSAQSGSGARAGAGLCETGLDITLSATRTAVPSLADWRPAGPAYPPASSPD